MSDKNEKEIVRKLTTILASDVAGYSAMMSADEESTLKTLRAYRKIIGDLIARHEGRIFNTAGDAVLAEFNSAVEGVRCAISIQEELNARNSHLPESQKMQFRIGLNVGDVMVDGTDLFGDGVNVAARLEGIAAPGGICISQSVFEQVKNKLSVGFQDMGPQRVKNIPYEVGAFQIGPGPVTVHTGGEEPTQATPARRRSNSRMVAVASFVVLFLLAGGYLGWMNFADRAKTLAEFPDSFSTDSMMAGDIEALMTGLTLQGVTGKGGPKSGRPLTIRVLDGGRVEATIQQTSDAARRQVGKWWVEDFNFCMQVELLAQGQKLCPRIVRKDGELYAVDLMGRRLDFALIKD